jgi:predicted metal-dependent HD superfamily phosphohydrolase
MNKIDTSLVQEAGNYITKLFAEKLPDSEEYHSIDHARYVSESAGLIGKKSGMSEDEINVVKLSAWFHDTGFIISPENNEKQSARIAGDFLTSNGIDDATIARVKDAILATCIPQQPTDMLSRVLCDADLMHLSEDNYFERIEKMRKEWVNHSGKKIGKRNFHTISVKFFKKHEYHTDFAKKELQPKKDKNLQLLQKKNIYVRAEKKEKTSRTRTKEGKAKRIFTWSGIYV